MKIGRDRQSLSDRLAAKLETETDQAAVWLNSSLQTFKTDCEALSKGALTTIEADMAELIRLHQGAAKKTLNAITQDLQSIRQVTTFGPRIIIAGLLGMIVMIYGCSYWLNQVLIQDMVDRQPLSSTLQQIGLTAHRSESGLLITWDQNRFSLADCRFPSGSVPCLQWSEKK